MEMEDAGPWQTGHISIWSADLNRHPQSFRQMDSQTGSLTVLSWFSAADGLFIPDFDLAERWRLVETDGRCPERVSHSVLKELPASPGGKHPCDFLRLLLVNLVNGMPIHLVSANTSCTA